MLTATRYHDISLGHRVHEHESKCFHLHGHNYRFHLTFKSLDEDAEDMVLDFGYIKKYFCKWLEKNWDHRFMIYANDPMAVILKKLDEGVCVVPFNPTAENIAWYFGTVIAPEIVEKNELTNVELIKIVIEETRKCSAEWSK